MNFYAGEAVQAQAEQARRGDEGGATATRNERKKRLELARQFYIAALPGLSSKDAIKARECKEGLAGALIAMAEYEGEGATAAARLREAQTLYRCEGCPLKGALCTLGHWWRAVDEAQA